MIDLKIIPRRLKNTRFAKFHTVFPNGTPRYHGEPSIIYNTLIFTSFHISLDTFMFKYVVISPWSIEWGVNNLDHSQCLNLDKKPNDKVIPQLMYQLQRGSSVLSQSKAKHNGIKRMWWIDVSRRNYDVVVHSRYLFLFLIKSTLLHLWEISLIIWSKTHQHTKELNQQLL